MVVAGKSLRMRRLSGPGDGRFLFVPLDHSVSDGPVVPQARWNGLLRALVTSEIAATTDSLTGQLNRRSMEEALRRLDNEQRLAGEPGMVRGTAP